MRLCTIIIVILMFNVTFSQSINHWETIIKTGDLCKYYIPTNDIGSDWKGNNFDDNAWTSATSGIGYGDNDDNTTIPTGAHSVYIRYSFAIEDKAEIAALLLDVDYDDAFIAYLNGTEIASGNISTEVTWNMKLYPGHEAAMYKGYKPDRFSISLFINEHLVEGENTLAVEIHNESTSSSDLSSNIFLHAGITATEIVYGDTPDWFWEPVYFTEFNLPLMIINTNGQVIPKEAPRINADMGLIYNGEGELNKDSDSWNEYSGKISIKQRGESSLGFLKKSYTIELQNEDGSNNNVSLLGLPAENDFVLHGPYSDKTMIKNVLTYELYRRTGKWAPRTRYIEIILNGDYRGVFVLTESLKRDENRVDIDKLTSNDTSAIDISGGYILRRDKTNGMDENEYWTSPVDQPYNQRMKYQYFDPKFEDLTSDQANYIKDWMKNFDEVMSGNNFKDPVSGYSQYIKVKSFIDMMFINEISKGIDNYAFSTYFHKENDADGGKLVAGAPWDYNLGYGNLDYGLDWDAPETYGWAFPQGGRTYWFKRLMEDETYKNRVYCRWTDFRSTIYSDESVISIIDSCINVLGDAVARNFEKYPKFSQYIWPAKQPIPDTYEEEIANLKSWLLGRLKWMDEQWLNIGACSENHDLVALSKPAYLDKVPIFANNVKPKLMLRNNGVNEEVNVPIKCEIDLNGTIVYSESIIVDKVESLEVLTVSFPEWQLFEINTYNITFIIQLLDDEENSNDTLRSSISITNLLDDFESGFENWTSNGNWGLDNRWANNGEYCLAINPDQRYENNTDSYAMYNYSFDLTSIENPTLTFWSQAIMADGDSGFVEISRDNGLNWEILSEPFLGIKTAWNEHNYSLKNYNNSSAVSFRFHFTSDAIKNHLGWFIDDIKIENIITSVDNNGSINLPNEYRLYQNYPNPFNPSTIIKYSIPKSDLVQLKIYDVLGKEVATLVNEEKLVGTYSVTFNAASLTSGIYFYKLKAGSFSRTKKLVLLQ